MAYFIAFGISRLVMRTPLGPRSMPRRRPRFQHDRGPSACAGDHRSLRRENFGANLRLHMLARYQIVRGKRSAADPLPDGRRIDTRKHTQHCLRPEPAQVDALFEDMSAAGFARFAKAYRATLEARFAHDRAAFDGLAQLAQQEDVYLGCSCPTQRNPDVDRCHTVLALRFMRERYPKLKVEFPRG